MERSEHPRVGGSESISIVKQRHAKTHLKIFVVVIPKEGMAIRAPPIINLV